MKQSRLESLIETIINTVIGFVFAIASQIVIFPFFGIHIPFSTNLEMGLWFTTISILRSYVIRRYFNSRLHSFSAQLAEFTNRNRS